MNFKKIFAFIGFIGVLLGAFGAHVIKNQVEPSLFEVWKTATLYLFVHVLAGLYAVQFAKKQRSAYLFFSGILIFSGSLYILALSGQKFLGAITPVGGLLFLLGWLMLVVDV